MTDLTRIDDGPVATVYSGHRAGVPVAVKVFPKRFDKRTMSSFTKEQTKLATVRRVTSILMVDGVEELPTGESALRMELCTQSLAALVERLSQLAAADVATLGCAMASALAAAHSVGVVHGGVSPSNVLFRDNGEPVVGDFGVTLRQAFTRDPLHAIEYLPPETLRNGTLNELTDLYGLGAVLHFALTGRSPHPGRLGEQPGERVLRILGEPVPAINRSDVPVGLSTLVARLLATTPDRRPQEAAQVADHLTAMLPNPPTPPTTEDWDDFDAPAPTPPPAREDPLDFDDFATRSGWSHPRQWQPMPGPAYPAAPGPAFAYGQQPPAPVHERPPSPSRTPPIAPPALPPPAPALKPAPLERPTPAAPAREGLSAAVPERSAPGPVSPGPAVPEPPAPQPEAPEPVSPESAVPEPAVLESAGSEQAAPEQAVAPEMPAPEAAVSAPAASEAAVFGSTAHESATSEPTALGAPESAAREPVSPKPAVLKPPAPESATPEPVASESAVPELAGVAEPGVLGSVASEPASPESTGSESAGSAPADSAQAAPLLSPPSDPLLPLAPLPTHVSGASYAEPGSSAVVTAPVATAQRSGVVLGGGRRDQDFDDDFGNVRRATVLAGPLSPPDQPGRRLIRYDLLAGAALLLALLALVPLLLLRGDPDEIPSSARLPAAGESDGAEVTVELAEPTDLTDKVRLSWKATRELDFAVVVAAEGEKPEVLLVQRNHSMTVDVEPGLRYCFMVQATDGDQVYESEPQPLRGATCRK